MIPCKPIMQKLTLVFLLSISLFTVKTFGQDGRALFMSKCASCHSPNLTTPSTGPALGGVFDKDPYNGDVKKFIHWAYNVNTLTVSDQHYADLKAQFGSLMTQFNESSLSEKDAEAIFAWVSKGPETNKPGPNTPVEETSNQNAVIFGVISLILAIIALILMQVNSNLKKMSDDAEGIARPEPVPFYRNKVYIAMLSIILFIVGGYLVTKGAIGLNRQKAYEPKQPIFYSHKVHAGINQINCLYCHGNAWESKSAAIPSVNVCMNCHKNITEYTKGPKLKDAEGNDVDGTTQIHKLYEYAGFDPKNANKWDPSKAKPIEWVRIHSLPDHVYFNHSQHVKAGKVQCQSCHGEITGMDEVKQFAELSMGWCINCHRQTKVDFNYDDKTGNKYYSIYEKFHNDIKEHKMDSVRVKDIGGLECQKCHY